MTITIAAPARTNIQGLAQRLVRHYHAWAAAMVARDTKTGTAKAAEIAKARYEGLLDAADALGLVPTQFAAYMIVADAETDTIDRLGARPAFRQAGNNDSLRAWDFTFAETVACRLVA